MEWRHIYILYSFNNNIILKMAAIAAETRWWENYH